MSEGIVTEQKARETSEQAHECNGPFGDEEQCPVHGEEIRTARALASPAAQELSALSDNDLYASYANHCAIEGKVALTFHSWKRERGDAILPRS